MESLLEVFDNVGNELNAILKKGGSNWVVTNCEGMSIAWELQPALERIGDQVEQVKRSVNMNESAYERLVESNTADVFNLNLDRLNSEEKYNFMEYVYGSIDEETTPSLV